MSGEFDRLIVAGDQAYTSSEWAEQCRRREYHRAWLKREHVKERKARYMVEYWKRQDVAERRATYMTAYRARPQFREQRARYRETERRVSDAGVGE